MSVYGYPVPTTPWLNTAPGLFIDDYTSTASSTVSSLSRTLIYDYEQNPDSGNNVVALAAKAGYSTWWISNQGKLGSMTRISVIASDAEHATFLKKAASLPVKQMTNCCYRKQNVRWRIHPLRR